MAFAISWGFHIVEEEGQERLNARQGVILCVIKDTSLQQQAGHPILLGPILEKCEQLRGKK